MRPNRIVPERAQAYADRYPKAYDYLAEHAYYVPDALKDSGAKRDREGGGVFTLMQKLKAVSECPALVHGELKLAHLDSAKLYHKRTIERAKEAVDAHFKARHLTTYIWKLERGRNGGTHAEVVIPADADLMCLTSYNLIETEEDEEIVAAYLKKPADARACGVRPKDLRVWTLDEVEEHRFQALEEWVRQTRSKTGRLRFLHSKGVKS
ncbi:hypothetical protein ACS0QO_00670 [Deinococcus aquaticus]